MIILGIETSCDETAASLLQIVNGKLQILSNVVSSQVKIHARYGGIVPEVAARKHVEMMIPVLAEAVAPIQGRRTTSLHPSTTVRASSGRGKGIAPSVKNGIDLIAVTKGPGLITSLLVGVETAKTLALVWNKPIVGVNHLAGHLWSWQLPVQSQILNLKSFGPSLRTRSKNNISNLKSNEFLFPLLALIVSGGHTELVLVKDYEKYQVVGQTLDDAAGEAFDKVAKILGLGYPGGPIISRLAEQGNPAAFDFPRPMIKSDDFNFSFAGLKTAVLYKVRDLVGAKSVGDNGHYRLPMATIQDLCASFQQAVVDTLMTKTIKAAKKYRIKTVVIGGGVSANSLLREQMQTAVEEEIPVSPRKGPPRGRFEIPDLKYCLDNAAMIALAGYYKFMARGADDMAKLAADPNWPLA